MEIKKIANSVNIKINDFLRVFVPIVLFLLVLLIVTNYIKALFNYSGWFLWWKVYNGKTYPNNIDLVSYALFNYSKLSFDIQQKLTTGPKQTNETSIMLMQAIVLNKAKKIGKGVIATPSNFTTPYHICKSISWGPDEGTEFCIALTETYKVSYSNIPSTRIPDTNVGDPYANVSAWFAGVSALISSNTPANDKKWALNQTQTTGGFWPHQNGCSGFFDIPFGGSGTSYNLFDNIPDARTTKDGKTFSRPPLYIPGASNFQGSWAQLFADWGIVYTINSQSGQSSVPVISDGASCSDKTTQLKPCPSTGMQWCSAGSDGNCGDGTLPTSNYLTWFFSSQTQSGSIGLNFLSTYNIHPASYIITSWVGDLYDDPKTGIIFDAQAFRNLVGYQGQNQTLGFGGWNMFLKGLNTNLTSYDNVMNEIFRQYATDFSPRAIISADSCTNKKKAQSATTDAIGGAMAGSMMGSFGGPPGMLIGGLFGLIAGAATGYLTAC
jgi:hypothetical protein